MFLNQGWMQLKKVKKRAQQGHVCEEDMRIAFLLYEMFMLHSSGQLKTVVDSFRIQCSEEEGVANAQEVKQERNTILVGTRYKNSYNTELKGEKIAHKNSVLDVVDQNFLIGNKVEDK